MVVVEDKISVVGLGKLGQCLAIALGHKNFETIGIDINQDVINSLNNNKETVSEPGLQNLLEKNSSNLDFTSDANAAIEKTDITMILVGTPSDREGWFSNEYVESSLQNLSEALKVSKKPYHLFVINSTVMPGSIDEVFIPLIERVSGRKLNEGFGICHCPELVALGTVVQNFLNPDFVIIGQSDSKAGDIVKRVYTKFCDNSPEYSQMSLINAELTKVTLNFYLTTKISFANHLSNLCERLPGADVDTVTNTLGHDSRISPKFMKGGLSFGGTCFPRDTKAFRALYDKYLGRSPFVESIDFVNEYQHDNLFRIVSENTNENSKICILGLSFKPDTTVVVDSPSIELAKRLLKKKIKVSGFDPLASSTAAEAINNNDFTIYEDIDECISNCNVFVIATPWKNFMNMENSFPANSLVIDCWRILDELHLSNDIKYIPIGKNLI